ncbi:MAG: glycosyltransferase family 2 protein [Lachnospiraceae bacterium]|nr:glycosyltransferase family 2 protein [Lachnospiraceae bacterium]
MKLSLYNLRKGFRYLKNYGLKEFFIRLKEKGEPEQISYAEYAASHKVTEAQLKIQTKESDKWSYRPLISCVYMGENREDVLAMLEQQSYTNWNVTCISKLGTGKELELSGEYAALIEAGDTIEPDAFYELAHAIAFPKETQQSGIHWEEVGKLDLIYTDEDVRCSDEVETSKTPEPSKPLLKPDFSPDYLESYCYIRHLCCIRKTVFLQALKENDGNPAIEDLIRRAAKQSDCILHIPKVLYHTGAQHVPKVERAPEIEYTTESAEQSEESKTAGSNEKQPPLVSILIPNKDEKASLEKCIASIQRGSYRNYEIIIIENNSKSEEIFAYYKELELQYPNIRVVEWKPQIPGTFNYSAINNYGASFAKGEYLLLLNNDIEIITKDYMEQMLALCEKEHTGAVGAKLYYPDDTIQHAGIVIGIGGHARGIAANMCVGQARSDSGYMHRASLRQNLSAATAAFLMVPAKVFREVNGFCEDLSVAFNDVDLCLKIRKKGYLIIYEPSVEAYHYESKSRGQEDTEEKVRRFQEEIEYMRTHWNDILRQGDPYYHPGLTRYRTDYSLGQNR